MFKPDPIRKSLRLYLVDKFVHKPFRIAKRFHPSGIKFMVTRFAPRFYGSCSVGAFTALAVQTRLVCAGAAFYGMNTSFGK